MKLSRVTIYPIDNTFILEASNLGCTGSQLQMSFDSVDGAFEYAKKYLASSDDIKAEREKVWHPPFGVMSRKEDPLPQP